MAKGTKTGGREKGTPNRTTAETKELLMKILSKELDNLPEMLELLEPNDRVNAISKLLPYVLPKQNEIKTDITTAETRQSSIDVTMLSTETLLELAKAEIKKEQMC